MHTINCYLLCRKQPPPVRINWASLNASREQVEAEKWAGKITDMCIRTPHALWNVQNSNTYDILMLISFTMSFYIFFCSSLLKNAVDCKYVQMYM